MKMMTIIDCGTKEDDDDEEDVDEDYFACFPLGLCVVGAERLPFVHI